MTHSISRGRFDKIIGGIYLYRHFTKIIAFLKNGHLDWKYRVVKVIVQVTIGHNFFYG